MADDSRHEESLILDQKVNRLKINRVALVQELKVEHVLPSLIRKGILSEDEATDVLKRPHHSDQTRYLLDLLPTKEKKVNWYDAFKQSLKNPYVTDTDTRKRYQILVEFLDNAIIPKPEKFAMYGEPPGARRRQLPHYKRLPHISSTDDFSRSRDVVVDDHNSPKSNTSDRSETPSETHNNQSNTKQEGQMDICKDGAYRENDKKQDDGLRYNDEKMTDKNTHADMHTDNCYHTWIPEVSHFASLVTEPTSHFDELGQSSDPEDHDMLRKEVNCLRKFRNLEKIIAFHRRAKLPDGFVLCLSKVLFEITEDPNEYHIYYKYMRQIRSSFDIDVGKILTLSYVCYLQSLPDGSAKEEPLRDCLVNVGFGLYDFLSNYGQYHMAETILYNLVHFLASYQALETWMATWEACIKIMSCRTTNVNFREADTIYHTALEVGRKIKLMSFGQDLLKQSEMYLELSQMMREQGSIGPAFSWSQEALREVDANEGNCVVDILCNASLAYSTQGNIKKAGQLSIEAVIQAKTLFTRNHPLYVKALLHYCHFSNEFIQDVFGIEAAKYALTTSVKVYGGCDSLLTAQAHQTLATALIVCHQSQHAEQDVALEQAEKAFNMAVKVLPPDHPRLAPFRYTKGQTLLWEAMYCGGSKRNSYLQWAKTEVVNALAVFRQYWGQLSLKTAQALSLLGQIYNKLDRQDEAEVWLKAATSTHQLGLTPSSQYIQLMRATLGIFYKTINRPGDAIPLFQEALQTLRGNGVYVKWVHMAYETLISLLHATGQKPAAAEAEANLKDWLSFNPPLATCSWQILNAPAKPYGEFYEEFTQVKHKLNNVKKGIKHIKENIKMVKYVASEASNTEKTLTDENDTLVTDGVALPSKVCISQETGETFECSHCLSGDTQLLPST